jgi:acyl-CoA synthetase (NDP forming)
MTQEAQVMQDEAGFPFLQELQPSLRAINALWFHAQRTGKIPLLPGPAPKSDLTPENLNEKLAAFGIHAPKVALAKTPKEAAQLAAQIGFPVVLKIRSPDILHKTEAGGVALDLRDGAAVEAAAQKILDSAKSYKADARIEGVEVHEMVSGGVEAIVGAREDVLYGPMLLVGSGGVLVELLEDVSLAMLPLDAKEIAARISGLKLAKLLDGYRGRPAADAEALAQAAEGLGRFFLAHREKIVDIEINPLVAREAGRGVVALDIRVLWR